MAGLFINAAGAYRKAKGAQVFVAGAWRKAKAIWVNSGGVWRKMPFSDSLVMPYVGKDIINDAPIEYGAGFIAGKLGELTPRTLSNGATVNALFSNNTSGNLLTFSAVGPANTTYNVSIAGFGTFSFNLQFSDSVVSVAAPGAYNFLNGRVGMGPLNIEITID